MKIPIDKSSNKLNVSGLIGIDTFKQFQVQCKCIQQTYQILRFILHIFLHALKCITNVLPTCSKGFFLCGGYQVCHKSVVDTLNTNVPTFSLITYAVKKSTFVLEKLKEFFFSIEKTGAASCEVPSRGSGDQTMAEDC